MSFEKFKEKWLEKKEEDDPKCCKRGWDHVHVVMQTLVVTGGFMIMTLYKALWDKYGRKIHHWEEALVTLFSSFFMIYLVYLLFNRKILTGKIW
jgi:hypothetical protein